MEINKDIADLEAAEVRKSKRKKFLLCYHNFNVKNCTKSAAEVRKIAAAAGSPISVAVVPSIGAVPESEAELFREEIGKLMDEGYEILLHGARHRADLFVKRGPIGKLALSLSHNGAEFCGLSKKLSQSLMNRAVALWEAHGYGKPDGFVPPVWFGNPFLKDQALERFDNYENLCHVYKKDGRKIASQILSFSILPKFLLGLSLLLACISMALPFGTPRLVLHTEDFKTIGEKRVASLVRLAVTLREKIQYKDL